MGFKELEKTKFEHFNGYGQFLDFGQKKALKLPKNATKIKFRNGVASNGVRPKIFVHPITFPHKNVPYGNVIWVPPVGGSRIMELVSQS